MADEDPSSGRALVIDDEPAIRGLLEALLRRARWEVVCASDREEALAAVTDARFDLVLLDLHLGDIDGRVLLDELATRWSGVRQATVFVTGAPPADGRLGDRPVLAKPFAWQDLAALLERRRR